MFPHPTLFFYDITHAAQYAEKEFPPILRILFPISNVCDDSKKNLPGEENLAIYVPSREVLYIDYSKVLVTIKI